MRARLLKPGFFSNEALGQLPVTCRLLFEGLWCLADREGRLEDRPLRVRAEVFPYDADLDAEVLLGQLSDVGLIVRYEVDGCRCIWLPKFTHHQKCHPREAQSILPPCPLENLVTAETDQDEPMVGQGATKDMPRKSQGSAKAAGKGSGIGSPSVREAVVVAVKGEPVLPAAAAPTRDPAGDKDLERLRSFYAANIGKVTPVISKELRQLLDAFPDDQIEMAFGEAIRCNHPNLKYVGAILERYKTEGFAAKRGTARRKNRRGADDQPLSGRYRHLVKH